MPDLQTLSDKILNQIFSNLDNASLLRLAMAAPHRYLSGAALRTLYLRPEAKDPRLLLWATECGYAATVERLLDDSDANPNHGMEVPRARFLRPEGPNGRTRGQILRDPASSIYRCYYRTLVISRPVAPYRHYNHPHVSVTEYDNVAAYPLNERIAMLPLHIAVLHPPA